MRTELDDDPRIVVNGWHYDPTAGAWTCRIGTYRWLVVEADPDDPPRFDPWKEAGR